MPAGLLSDLPTALPQYATIGVFNPTGCFVAHVGLLRKPLEDVNFEDTVPVFQQGPPLVVGTSTLKGRVSQMNSHVYGFFPFDENQILMIESFLASVDVDNSLSQYAGWKSYMVLPHAIKVRSESEKGMLMFWRFSCAGLVHQVYEEAGILLCDIKNFPNVGLETLRQVYGENLVRMRNRAGLEDNEKMEWPILMPGYLIHSLNRDPLSIQNTPLSPSTTHSVFCQSGKCDPIQQAKGNCQSQAREGL